MPLRCKRLLGVSCIAGHSGARAREAPKDGRRWRPTRTSAKTANKVKSSLQSQVMRRLQKPSAWHLVYLFAVSCMDGSGMRPGTLFNRDALGPKRSSHLDRHVPLPQLLHALLHHARFQAGTRTICRSHQVLHRDFILAKDAAALAKDAATSVFNVTCPVFT